MRQIPVTLALVTINAILFFIIAFYHDTSIFQLSGLDILKWGGNFNPYTLDGEVWRLLSSMFLHFSLIHLAVNMHSLYSLGKVLEKELRAVDFLLVYLLCGIAGGLASLQWNFFVISAGASGAIFGLYGFVVAMDFIVHLRNRRKIHELLINFVIFAVINIAISKAFSVDIPGHLGGLIFGIAAGMFYSFVKKNKRFSLKSFSLVTSLLLIQLYFFLPSFQVKYFHMFQHLIETEEFTDKAMRNAKNDAQLRKDLLLARTKWDTTFHAIDQLKDLPEPLLTDKTILQEYIQLRKEDLRYRITGIEMESYIYRDSTEEVAKALSNLPSVQYVLNFKLPKELPSDTTQNKLTYTQVYYDSTWQETSKAKAVYYRQGGKDSLGHWSGYVVDYYLNGDVQMKGFYNEDLKDGVFMYYSPFRTYTAAGRYEKEYKVGKWQYFHRNGTLSREINHSGKNYIINAWDSTGRQIVKGGEGEMTEFYPNGNLKRRGAIKEGLKEGEWTGFYRDGSPYFEEIYRKGVLEIGRSVLKSGEKFTYDESSFYANPKGGMEAFYAYVSENIRYPEEARRNKIRGSVSVAFSVDEDGMLRDILYLKRIGYGCEEEAKRLLEQGPRWFPGRMHGHESYLTQGRVDIYFGEPEEI